MLVISTYAAAFLERFRDKAQRLSRQAGWKTAAAGAAGFVLSAASVAGQAMPLALGLLCAAPPGLYAAAIAAGGCLGYLLFWGQTQGLAWMAAGLLAVALIGDSALVQRQKLLMSAVTALIVSGCGLGFALCFLDDTAVPVYILRVVLSSAATFLFRRWREEPSGAAGWMACGIATVSLAQIVPVRWLGLGYLAAGFLGTRASFPAAAMAGLGLDLAQVTALPMTGVMCLAFCLRLVPGLPKQAAAWGPGLSYLLLCALMGKWDALPLPGLLIGGLVSTAVPGNLLTPARLQRKGPTGLAQVRLEKAAISLRSLEQALLLTQEPDIDSRSLLRQAADQSCDTCPERKGCKARHLVPGLSTAVLEQPGLQTADLPPGCRKPGRLLRELGRGQEQLRRIKGDRSRQRSYRTALADQYRFLSETLQSLSDQLCSLHPHQADRFRPEIGISGRSLSGASGDVCVSFPGPEGLHYLLLCDGMGTGEGAARDAAEAAGLLRKLLEGGASPDSALRTFNSLCALRFSGGSATVDLLELDLRFGRAAVYKWGAGPSYLLSAGQLKKIGTAGPPPGLSQQARESVERLSLGLGETLIMLSDGAGAEGLARPEWTAPDTPPGEMAAWILERSVQREDDATVAVVRLSPLLTPTQ